MYLETKTTRTLIATMMIGPKGKLLKAAEYVEWLDNEGWKVDEISTVDESLVSTTTTAATCESCGRAFEARRSTARYCSRVCEGRKYRVKAAERRRAELLARIA